MTVIASEINDKTVDLLSIESKTLLKVFSKQWAISEAFQIISYLDEIFRKYQSDEIPTSAILGALENVHYMKRKSGWLTGSEVNNLFK